MQEKEFNAMVRLLEDDDPQVVEHVESRLLSMGENVIPRLEKAWESNGNAIIQTRILEVIQIIQQRQTSRDLKAWRMSGGMDLLEGWMLVSQYQFPDIDPEKYRDEFNRLTNLTWLEMRDNMSAAEKLTVVNRVLFVKERFKPNAEKDPLKPEHFFINTLFERKKGSPIALGLLYLVICQQLKLPVSGLILPGYFALHYGDHRSEFYIDVYNRGAFFVKKDLKSYLKKIKLQEKSSYFKPTSRIYVVLELIRHLIGTFKKRKKTEHAEAYERLLKEIEPDGNISEL